MNTGGACNDIRQEDTRYNNLEAVEQDSDAFADASSEYRLSIEETAVSFTCEHNLRTPYIL